MDIAVTFAIGREIGGWQDEKFKGRGEKMMEEAFDEES